MCSIIHTDAFDRLNAEHDALRAENEEYASQITTLEWQLSEATKAAELAQAQYHHSTQGRVAMQTKIDALRAVIERLRAMHDPESSCSDIGAQCCHGCHNGCCLEASQS